MEQEGDVQMEAKRTKRNLNIPIKRGSLKLIAKKNDKKIKKKKKKKKLSLLKLIPICD